MDRDDETVGFILSRRDALRWLAAGTTTALAGCSNRMMGTALAACVARPRQTEGPYFVDELLNRFTPGSPTPPGGSARCAMPATASTVAGDPSSSFPCPAETKGGRVRSTWRSSMTCPSSRQPGAGRRHGSTDRPSVSLTVVSRPGAS